MRERVDVSDVYLTGYSLGAANAAWVARLDEGQHALGFRKALLLNPPVSLYSLTRILDAMYDRHVPADPRGAQLVVHRIFSAFARVYSRQASTNLDGEFLYQAYRELEPGPEALETLIGTSFRVSSANLAFTSDAISRGGYMVAPDADLGSATSLTGILKHADRQSFADYIDKLYLPYFQARDPSFTKERAIREASAGGFYREVRIPNLCRDLPPCCTDRAGWRREGPGGVGEPPLPRFPDPAVPFKANAARRHRIPRQRHRVTNWAEYEAALRQRGSLTVWFTDAAVAAWRAEPRTTRGGQPWYSPLAILTALTLRAVFRLALRQTEGLIGSILRLLGLELAVPDHSTLSRRAETLEVPRPKSGGEPVHLLVDSTGLKLCGAGEWLTEKHGTSRRRSWRKLHVGVDADTGRIVAAELTTNDVDDGSRVGPLLDRVAGPVASLTGDGAYDQEGVYASVAERHPEAAVIVPSRSTAVPSGTAETAPTQRDRHLRFIAEHGRMGWQKASGYNKRARAGAAISRYKRVIGDGLRSRTDRRQATEVAIAGDVLNRMLELGRPNYVRVV